MMWYLPSLTNLPDLLLGVVCTDAMNELTGMLDQITKAGDVKTLAPNIWYADYVFETRRDWLTAHEEPQDKVH